MFAELRNQLQDALDDGVPFDDAIESIVSLVLSDEEKITPVVREAVKVASRYTTRAAVSDQRRLIWSRANKLQRNRADSKKRITKAVAGLMKFRLPGGKTISEATGTECAEAAEFYMSIAKTEYHRAKWLEKVASAAGGRKVGKALSETKLQKLYESAGVFQ